VRPYPPSRDAGDRRNPLLQHRRLGRELHRARRGHGWPARAPVDGADSGRSDRRAPGAGVMPRNATRRSRGRVAPFAYGRIAARYGTGFRVLGFKRGVEQFLSRVEWSLPARARVLDAGAGTGIIGLWFLRRFPDAEVVAFDIDEKMLAVLGRSARGLGESR